MPHFHTRLFSERTALNWADSVVVSTEEERYQQYGLGLYEGAIDIEDHKFVVIPPGVNTEAFYPWKGFGIYPSAVLFFFLANYAIFSPSCYCIVEY